MYVYIQIDLWIAYLPVSRQEQNQEGIYMTCADSRQVLNTRSDYTQNERAANHDTDDDDLNCRTISKLSTL